MRAIGEVWVRGADGKNHLEAREEYNYEGFWRVILTTLEGAEFLGREEVSEKYLADAVRFMASKSRLLRTLTEIPYEYQLAKGHNFFLRHLAPPFRVNGERPAPATTPFGWTTLRIPDRYAYLIFPRWLYPVAWLSIYGLTGLRWRIDEWFVDRGLWVMDDELAHYSEGRWWWQ